MAPGARVIVTVRLLAALTASLALKPGEEAEVSPDRAAAPDAAAPSGSLCLTLPRYLLFPAFAAASALAATLGRMASGSASEASTASEPLQVRTWNL